MRSRECAFYKNTYIRCKQEVIRVLTTFQKRNYLCLNDSCVYYGEGKPKDLNLVNDAIKIGEIKNCTLSVDVPS